MKYRSHGGALITKIALDELLRKVLKMEENDYGREFDVSTKENLLKFIKIVFFYKMKTVYLFQSTVKEFPE